jgi:hypothetical protein
VIALNPTTSATTIRVIKDGKHFNFQIPGKSVVTFRWNERGADFDNGNFDDGGFQQGGGSLDAWNVFGNTRGNVSAATEAVLTGDRSLKMYGQFSGSDNVSGVSQGMTVSAGERVQASLNSLVRSAEAIAGTNNVARMKIEFYREYGGAYGSASFLGETEKVIADGDLQNDVWNEHQITGTAPPGATEARLVLQFLQHNNQPGAVHIDKVSFGITDALAAMGDYNHDEIVNQADFDVWRSNFGSPIKLDADGNGNGIVDAADYSTWRTRFMISGAEGGKGMYIPEPSGLWMALGAALAMAATPNSWALFY